MRHLTEDHKRKVSRGLRKYWAKRKAADVRKRVPVRRCPCGTYSEGSCRDWPRCVSI